MNLQLRNCIAVCVFFVLLLAMIGPVSATVHTINADINKSEFQAVVNGMSDGDVLLLNPGTYRVNDIAFSQNISIEANTAAGGNKENTIIDGIGSQLGIFSASGFPNSITVNNLTFRNGQNNRGTGGGAISAYDAIVTTSTFSNFSASSGGAIFSFGNTTVTSSTFSNCSSTNGGGAINSNGNLKVTSSTFFNCSAKTESSWGGGAIQVWGLTVAEVTDSTFTNCSATGNGGSTGGAINSWAGKVIVTGSTFTNCSASSGGAIRSGNTNAITGPSITVTSSTFSNCLAQSGGGAIDTNNGNITVTTSAFSYCSAGQGGAISTSVNGFVTVNSSTFTNCSAYSGGAIYQYYDSVTVISSTFTNCSSTGYGGAIHMNSQNPVTVRLSNFTNCSAVLGGAISSVGDIVVTESKINNCSGKTGGAIYSWGRISVNDTTITYCSTTENGGAIYTPGWITVTSSTLTNCSAVGNGGAIYSGSSPVLVTSSTLTNCSAMGNGGAIYTGDTVTITSSTISNSTSGGFGAAIYTTSGTIQFSRLVNDNPGTVVYSSGHSVNATHNWWGSNRNPSAQINEGVITSPWLILGITATPISITNLQTSTVQVNLTYDSNGTYHNPALGHVPDGIPIKYTITTGSVLPSSGKTADGTNTTIFSPSVDGAVIVNATVDGQTVSTCNEKPGTNVSPVANFTANPLSGKAPLTVYFTDISTGNPTSWNWSFGDDSMVNVTEQNPVHTYTTAGTYTVSLNVTNASGSNISVRTNYITVRLPDVSVTGITPATGINTTSISITNLSGSNFKTGATVMLTPVNASPTHKGSIVNGAGGANLFGPESVSVSGNYAYVASYPGNSLEIVDISNTANPTHKGSITNGTDGALLYGPRGVYVSGNYAYVASTLSQSLEIVDISNPENPTHKGSITNGTGGALLHEPMSVYVSGNYAYVTSNTNDALEIIDISNPANPTHKGSIMDGAGGAQLFSPKSVYVSGDYAYVAGGHALEIIDISNPASPTHKGSIMDGAGVAPYLHDSWCVYVSGNYAYVASQGRNALEIIDISDPASPTHEGSIANGEGGALLISPMGIYVSDNFAYVASWSSNALEIIDISNPSIPVHAGNLVNGADGALLREARSVFVSGNYAYVASSGNNALEIVDIGKKVAVAASDVTVISPTQITCVFDLINKSTGLYNVVVTNTDGSFGVLPSGFTVMPSSVTLPVANFTANVTSGTAPLAVRFTDMSTGTPTAWNWSFGDGAFSTVQHPEHVFTNAGIYSVSLIVTNPNGTNTLTKTGYISAEANLSYRARLILPQVSLYQNTSTKIPIQVANITQGTGLSFNLTYDSSIIRVNTITLNQSYASGSNLVVNSTPGLTRLSLTSTDEFNIGSPTQLLTLDVTGTGTVGSSIDLFANNAQWGTSEFGVQQFDVVNGTILIYRVRGDFNGNGEVDIGDISRVAYMVVGRTPIDMAADFNNVGTVDIGDAAKIAWFFVGKIPEL